MESRYRTPMEIVEGFVGEGVKKATTSTMKTIVLGIMAGMFIAFGACTSNVAAHLIQNTGVAKMAAGAIFPVGLMMIVFIGGELFTGDCLMLIGCMHKKYKVLKMIEKLTVVFFSNLIGALIVVLLAYYCGQWELSASALGAYTIKVALGKANLSFGKALCSGVLCNLAVCLAVLMGYAAKDIVGKVWAIFFPIFAFVVGGFEHCDWQSFPLLLSSLIVLFTYSLSSSQSSSSYSYSKSSSMSSSYSNSKSSSSPISLSSC